MPSPTTPNNGLCRKLKEGTDVMGCQGVFSELSWKLGCRYQRNELEMGTESRPAHSQGKLTSKRWRYTAHKNYAVIRERNPQELCH